MIDRHLVNSITKKIIYYTLIFGTTFLFFTLIIFFAAKSSENNSLKKLVQGNEAYFNNSFDSFTLCYSSLAFSGFDESKSVVWNAAIAPQLIGSGKEPPCEVLTNFANNEYYSQIYTTHSRYWHGSGAIFIIGSNFLSFDGFKVFYFLLMIYSFVFFGSMFSDKSFGSAPTFFLISILLGSNHFLFESNFAHIFPLISALIFGGIVARVQEKNQGFFLFIAGMWSNFLDLLLSPTLYFSITLLGYLLAKLEQKTRSFIREFVAATLLWFGGYFGIWVAKWVFAETFGEQGEIRKALNHALTRTSEKAFNDIDSSFFYPLILNINSFLSQPFNSWLFLSFFFILAILLIASIYFRKLTLLLNGLAYLVLNSIVIILWYAILRNHSLIHSWFTFRSLAAIPALTFSIGYICVKFSIQKMSTK